MLALSCRRASPHTPCVFYLPRLEAWALSKVGPTPLLIDLS